MADFSVGPGAASLAARLGAQLAGSFDDLLGSWDGGLEVYHCPSKMMIF